MGRFSLMIFRFGGGELWKTRAGHAPLWIAPVREGHVWIGRVWNALWPAEVGLAGPWIARTGHGALSMSSAALLRPRNGSTRIAQAPRRTRPLQTYRRPHFVQHVEPRIEPQLTCAPAPDSLDATTDIRCQVDRPCRTAFWSSRLTGIRLVVRKRAGAQRMRKCQ